MNHGWTVDFRQLTELEFDLPLKLDRVWYKRNVLLNHVYRLTVVELGLCHRPLERLALREIGR